MKELSVTDFVLKRFGGMNALARALNRPLSTVQKWKESGAIHPRNWPEIEQAAFREGFFDITAVKLGEMHASQEVRRAAAARTPPPDPTTPKKTAENENDPLVKGAA